MFPRFSWLAAPLLNVFDLWAEHPEAHERP